MKWQSGPQADLSRLPVSLDIRAVSVAEGVRAAFAIAAIMLLNQWFGLPLLTEAAVGALLTCLCDSGGPLRRRIPALLTFAALGTLAVVGFGLIRPLGLLVSVPLATLAIGLLSFARIWGPVPMQVGNLLVVVTILSLDNVERPYLAIELGTVFGLGSLWALLLTMAIWRIHPYRPARLALAETYRRLGNLVTELVPLLAGQDQALWAAHARAHRRHVREGIEAARVLVLDTVRIRGGGSVRASQSVIQMEAADQIFGVLIALSDALEHADAATRQAAATALPALRLLLAAIADVTARDHTVDDPEIRAVATRLLAVLAELEQTPSLAGLVHALIDRLRIAFLLNTPEGLRPGVEGARTRLSDRLLGPIRANLTWASPNLRHAARCTVLAAPALAFTLTQGDSYAHWLTITLVLTMQPFFAAAWQKALERSAGTVLGGVAAAAIASLVTSPLATALVMTPLAIAAFTVRAVSFGLFMTFLTPMVVLLSELGRPGTSEFVIAALRALYTVLGGTFAVLGNMLLWPSWEPVRIRQCTADAIRAHAAYADLELAALIEPGSADPARLETVRRAAGLASNTLEAALNRALQEPRQTGRREAETALLVDAALRRLAGRLLTLQHDPAQAGTDPALLAAWRNWFAGSLAALAAGEALPGHAPPERNHPVLGRMARQVELIAGALRPRPVRAATEPAPRATPTPPQASAAG